MRNYDCWLPKAEAFTRKARTTQMWGAAAAQIFSEASPQMHEEFALRYEKRWLERFALSYYGCCEPLDNKIEILETIENLRKISVSPWCSLERVCEAAGGKYVISYKPSPAVFAVENWDLDTAKKDLIHSVRTARSYGCSMEIIMKDISTINYTPQRLWEWTQMASDVCTGE